MIDLNPSHLAIVERILAEHVPECEVRAFGSRASWTAKDYSDLDLAIVGDGPLDWRTLGLLKEAFEESDLPMRVDVLDWYDIAESFQRVIERSCVVVQERVEESRGSLLEEFTETAYGKFPSDFQVAPLSKLCVDKAGIQTGPFGRSTPSGGLRIVRNTNHHGRALGRESGHPSRYTSGFGSR